MYYWLFASRAPAAGEANITISTPPPPPAAEPEAVKTPEPKKITAQASGGSAVLTIPVNITQEQSATIGITVLPAGDVNLPADSVIAGGIYSLYPAGITFAESINLLISVDPLALPAAGADYYVGLAGAAWQEVTNAVASSSSWSVNFTKFPSVPLSIVRRPAQATSTPALLGAEKTPPSADTDADGLTDKEEALLGTDPQLPDTDGDTHPDKTEILNNYNPLAPGAALAADTLLAIYTNPTYGYKVAHPAKWLADALDQTNKQVLFISDTEEFFEVLVEENPGQKPIVDWYRAQAPTLKDAELDVTVIAGASAVWSLDGLTLYVARDSLIYILTYNKGTRADLNWPGLFEVFYRSFSFGNTGN